MSAGLPGLGLGGLLFIILGLAAPFVEGVRSIMGRSSTERWRIALRQFVLALAILVALERAYWLASRIFGLGQNRASGAAGSALPLTPIVLTLAVLVVVLVAAGLLRRFVRASGPADPVSTVVVELRRPATSSGSVQPTYWSICSPAPRTMLPGDPGPGSGDEPPPLGIASSRRQPERYGATHSSLRSHSSAASSRRAIRLGSFSRQST
jgi:hypothetical protein